MAEIKVKMALLGNFDGIGAGLRHHRKEIVHLIGGFQIKLVGLKFHLVRILDGFAGLDAEQNFLNPGVFLAQIVGVIGGRHGNPGIPCQLNQLGQDRFVLGQAVVLQLNIVVALSKQVIVPQGGGFGPLVIPCQQCLGDFTCQTGRQTDQTFVVLFQQLLINPRLGIKALGESSRYHFDEVFVAGLILAQQDQVVVAVDLADLIKAGAGGYIDFTPDDGLNACFFGGLVKLHTPVHHPVVGAGDGRLAALLDPLHHLIDAAGAVQQAVFGMNMQVYKAALCSGGFTHGVVLPPPSGPAGRQTAPPAVSDDGPDPTCWAAAQRFRRGPTGTARDTGAA